MLYLVATPIGHLDDISARALATLASVDLILAEDTRRSSLLLNHFSIKTPMESFHLFNEHDKQEKILDKLHKGQKIALISDAGTPGICDPGAFLVQACRKEKISVQAIPGASALTMTLSLLGLTDQAVQFIGFAPKKDLEAFLLDLLCYEGVSLFFQSPTRLRATLCALAKLCPAAHLAVARELTKLHEEWVEGSALEVQEHFMKQEPRGECVLALYGKKPLAPNADDDEKLLDLLLNKYHLKPSKAAAILTQISPALSRQNVYRNLSRIDKSND